MDPLHELDVDAVVVAVVRIRRQQFAKLSAACDNISASLSMKWDNAFLGALGGFDLSERPDNPPFGVCRKFSSGLVAEM
ncbi:hypothetical protein [Lentzea guizhouensis]|uniref:hypothetical protein n=1 Tax=Lentzea guizhouensis TaxID=1586287 RepID=UPI0012B685DC|nr:hypothetical protein [Lentzea guizhouensis]